MIYGFILKYFKVADKTKLVFYIIMKLSTCETYLSFLLERVSAWCSPSSALRQAFTASILHGYNTIRKDNMYSILIANVCLQGFVGKVGFVKLTFGFLWFCFHRNKINLL